MLGKIHSFQSLGTVDGPGVRFVVFMHGCNLSCRYCHNIDVVKGEFTEYSPEEVAQKIIKYKEYFSDDGGVTVSGGEPVLQAKFVLELFKILKEKGIHTAIDTSGSLINDDILELLEYTDLVLLDVKMSNNADYLKYIGCEIDKPLAFLEELQKRNIKCWIRQVIVEGINDTDSNIDFLNELASDYRCVEKIELLPFKKICKEKYEQMNLKFPFDKYNETSSEIIDKLKKKLSK